MEQKNSPLSKKIEDWTRIVIITVGTPLMFVFTMVSPPNYKCETPQQRLEHSNHCYEAVIDRYQGLQAYQRARETQMRQDSLYINSHRTN